VQEASPNTPTVEADVYSVRTGSDGARPSTAILSSMSSVRPRRLNL
jgi:hypothetical protein